MANWHRSDRGVLRAHVLRDPGPILQALKTPFCVARVRVSDETQPDAGPTDQDTEGRRADPTISLVPPLSRRSG